jgi:hypothetical protein
MTLNPFGMTLTEITGSLMILLMGLMPEIYDPEIQNGKVHVLSVGSFHMTCTSDANTTPFNAKDPKRIEEIKALVEKLIAFQPTIIVVEFPYDEQHLLDEDFNQFLSATRKSKPCDGEIIYVGYEAAKRAGLKKIYGIDSRLDYDYKKITDLARELKSETYLNFNKADLLIFKPMKKEFVNSHTVTELFAFMNQKAVLDELYNINAAIFTYVNTANGYEGADVAADFYKRNLRIFANLNKIPKTPQDRILMLMGAGHSPFLNEFITKSPVYKLEDVSAYLQ